MAKNIVICCDGTSNKFSDRNTNVLELFSPGDRIPVNYHAIEDHLLGLTPIEVVVEGDPRAMLTNATLESYRELLEQTLAEEPLVRQVVSILLEPTRGRKSGPGASRPRRFRRRGRCRSSSSPATPPMCRSRRRPGCTTRSAPSGR